MAGLGEFERFQDVIKPMIAMYGYPSDELVSAYWRVLRSERYEAVLWAIDQLMGDPAFETKRPTAAQIKAKARTRGSSTDQWYIRCQQHHCRSLIPWPTDRTDEGRMFCGLHQPDHAHPATTNERISIAADLTPAARAFLRSCGPELQALMATIPVTDEEAAYTEPEEKYRLRKERKPMSDQVVAEAYGVSVDAVKEAQANASQRTLEPM